MVNYETNHRSKETTLDSWFYLRFSSISSSSLLSFSNSLVSYRLVVLESCPFIGDPTIGSSSNVFY